MSDTRDEWIDRWLAQAPPLSPRRRAAIERLLHGDAQIRQTANENENAMAATWTHSEPPSPHTHYVWDASEDCPLGWVPVCRRCGNGPLTGDDEALGVCSGCDQDRVLPPKDQLVDGVNEVELAPELSTRFGFCRNCEMVYPPNEMHECEHPLPPPRDDLDRHVRDALAADGIDPRRCRRCLAWTLVKDDIAFDDIALSALHVCADLRDASHQSKGDP